MNKPLRVLQVLPELTVGGVETGTVDFAKYLLEHGHTPVVVSNGGKLTAMLEEAGIRHYALPVHKKSLWTAWKTVRPLREIIRSEKIDIVHARSRVPAWIAYFACRKTSAKFITTCHGHYSNRLFSSVMGWSKSVIVPSEAIGRHMIETYRVPAENIRCIPRSVDLKRFRPRKEDNQRKSEFVITIVGRLTPLKGHAFFLKAMAKVVRVMPYVKIWIIGDAPPRKQKYREELEVLARRLGLKDTVQFLGSRQDVPDLLAQSDVCVMSSVTPESFGRVILEAQAVGVPVVATRVGGVMDIIDDGKTGLLVLPKDSEAMAQAVLRLLKDRGLARSLVSAAYKKLKTHFTVDRMSNMTLDVYRELMDSLNILVIKISALGDVILVTAALRALRRKFPKAKICCLVGEASRAVIQRCPYIDEMLVIDYQYKQKGWWSLWRFTRLLRKHRFDVVVDFQNNLKSHILAWMSLARETYGYNNGKAGFLLTHPVQSPDHQLPPVAHQFQVLEMLGLSYPKDDLLELWPADADINRARQMLESEWVSKGMSIVGINLAASGRWPSKNWPIEHMAKLCDLLAPENIRVILTGMEKDEALARKLMSLTRSKPANFVGRTSVMDLAALIKRCRVYLTPDSAPLHIAAAVRTPVIAFFGPTASARHCPPAKQCFVFERSPDCAPCYSPNCRIATHVCMQEITPESVFEKIQEMMSLS